MNDDSIQLTDRIRLLVDRCFVAEEQEEALFILSQLDKTYRESERIQVAAIKGASGSLKELASCIDIANADFRNLLMWSGFGEDIQAHLKWAEEILSNIN